MRPVNLIPLEERHGQMAPLRTGALAYVIVAVLAVALAGVTAVVITGNKISDRKADVASLKSKVAVAKAEADRLSAYTDFAAMQQARQDTVTSLATSRFDWERVLRELAIVIPDDVWMTSVTAAASSDPASSSTSSSTGSSATAEITGPSLDIQGCAAGHEAVAKFLASLREVDGVTRVSVMSSDRPEADGSTTSSTSSSASQDSGVSCATRDFISTFEVVAAFDAAQPVAATPSAATTPSATPSTAPAGQTAAGDAQSQSGDASTAVVSGTGTTP
jgi:Tfp pilus assembly protein PilN